MQQQIKKVEQTGSNSAGTASVIAVTNTALLSEIVVALLTTERYPLEQR